MYSVARHERHKLPIDDQRMRYLAAIMGLLGTLVLLAPFH